MLVLTRRTGESVRIGPEIRVTVVTASGGQVRIAIDAPEDVAILREEIFERVASANVEAASLTTTMASGTGSPSGIATGQSGGNDR